MWNKLIKIHIAISVACILAIMGITLFSSEEVDAPIIFLWLILAYFAIGINVIDIFATYMAQKGQTFFAKFAIFLWGNILLMYGPWVISIIEWQPGKFIIALVDVIAIFKITVLMMSIKNKTIQIKA
jgi:hypothetical protein